MAERMFFELPLEEWLTAIGLDELSFRHVTPECHNTRRKCKARYFVVRGQRNIAVCERCYREMGDVKPWDIPGATGVRTGFKIVSWRVDSEGNRGNPWNMGFFCNAHKHMAIVLHSQNTFQVEGVKIEYDFTDEFGKEEFCTHCAFEWSKYIREL